MQTNGYVIRGGIEGRERLRILSRVMRPATLAVLKRAELQPGWNCLDVGCGGGDVTREIARIVGDQGRVVGCDIDAQQLDLARRETEEADIRNVEYRNLNVATSSPAEMFDCVYSRFLLTHLVHREAVVGRLRDCVVPGGLIVIEDIDFRGHFSHPPSPALARYVELYSQVVRRNGGDPEIGPKLPAIVAEAGFEVIDVAVAQPAGFARDIKLVNAITLEKTAAAIEAAGLSTVTEIRQLVDDLYRMVEDPNSLASVARVIQVVGRHGRT